MFRRPSLLAAAAVLAGCGSLISAGGASAHYVRVNWSSKSDDCKKHTDPVTVVYEGSAKAGRVWLDLRSHTKWTHNDPDYVLGHRIAHTFSNGHGGCDDQHNELADHSGFGNTRYHVRVSNTQHEDSRGNLHVFLTPHHEVWKSGVQNGIHCQPGTHAVSPGHHDPDHKDDKYYEDGSNNYYSGFDAGRDKVIHYIANSPNSKRHHKISYHQWRNTRAIKQCNGWMSGSSGVTFGVTMGRVR